MLSSEMTTRDYLTEELRTLEHKTNRTREENARVQVIARQLRQCFCRNCTVKYDNEKSRADYTGYCSMKCQHAKSKELGHKPGKNSEFSILQSAGMVGDVPVIL